MNIKEYRGLIIGLLSVVVLLALWRLDSERGRNDDRIINLNELTEIKATLSTKPTIETAEQGGPWVPIKLNEFPEFRFDIADVKYPAFRAKEFVNEISAGDSVILSVLTYDYKTKIEKQSPLRSSEQIINYSVIEPYTIQSRNKVYMTLMDVNAAWQDNHAMNRWLIYRSLGITAFIWLVYSILNFTRATKGIKNWLREIQSKH